MDFCRTKGIISAKAVFGATVDGDIDVDAIMRFCFGPVRKELEGKKRMLQGFSDFHGNLVSRIYQVRFETTIPASLCETLW